jgi:hypothetical protein
MIRISAIRTSSRTTANTTVLALSQWGLDMVGKLHKSWPGGHVYMLVAVEKFTKWVEAAPITTQDSTAAINFIKSIVFRFGVPHSIISSSQIMGQISHQRSSKATARIW